MSTESEHTPTPSLLERILAYVSVALIAFAFVSYITTLIVGMAAGREALASSMWPIVVWISYIGLPLGFIFLMALLVINYTKRARSKRQHDRS